MVIRPEISKSRLSASRGEVKFFRNAKIERFRMRGLGRGIIIFLPLVNMGMVFAEEIKDVRGQTLCYQGEIEYFSCELQSSRKIISVCASGNTSPDHGYVQYRTWYQGNINYTYPKQFLPPRGRFFIVDVTRLSAGLGSHLKFFDVNLSYVISTAMVPGEIYIVKNGEIVFEDFCRGGAYQAFGRAVRAGLEYGERDHVDDLESQVGDLVE